mmetsp:Transcript_21590/g.56303  ORF Transcript_21590/g.56303 Transcript_21590/m.56303 type:complete len:235 (-) Transcript_21590:578-1282(-)
MLHGRKSMPSRRGLVVEVSTTLLKAAEPQRVALSMMQQTDLGAMRPSTTMATCKRAQWMSRTMRQRQVRPRSPCTILLLEQSVQRLCTILQLEQSALKQFMTQATVVSTLQSMTRATVPQRLSMSRVIIMTSILRHRRVAGRTCMTICRRESILTSMAYATKALFMGVLTAMKMTLRTSTASQSKKMVPRKMSVEARRSMDSSVHRLQAKMNMPTPPTLESQGKAIKFTAFELM